MLGTEPRSEHLRAIEAAHCAHNYLPLPVVIERGEGVWVQDVEGRRYFDALSAYSALNFGHRHPQLVAATLEQLGRLTLTSRAFHNDQLGSFCEELARFCGKQLVLPMNTGAEARGDRDQGCAQMGLRVQGGATGPSKDRRLRRQLPRAHHDDRLVFRRPARANRLRPLRSRLCVDPVWRCRPRC